MRVRQLSLFLENRPGQLAMACRALGDAGIDILTMSLADTEQFGIFRFIVREPDRALRILEENRFVVSANEVVPLAVAHEPGGLAGVLEKLEQQKLNVEYMYLFPCTKQDEAVLIVRFENTDAAISTLDQAGIRTLAAEDLLESAAG
ncbi:MAG: ACT domain-containing protein [Phycisphaeraceae bacterium]